MQRVIPLVCFTTKRQFSCTFPRFAGKKAALIVGAGDSTGSAISRAFANEGFHICAVRRNKEKLSPLISEISGKGQGITGLGVDCRKEDQVQEMVKQIETDIGPIEVAVHNIGANVHFGITQTTARVYYKVNIRDRNFIFSSEIVLYSYFDLCKVWEMACFSGFLVGKEVATRMRERGAGTIIFTGATASVRGGVGFSAFSGAKFGLRSLSQSMARELGPEGIHVAHVVVDGGIDTPFVFENLPGAKELAKIGGLLNPDEIAQNYIHLFKQPKSAWTQEMDLRPYCEKW